MLVWSFIMTFIFCIVSYTESTTNQAIIDRQETNKKKPRKSNKTDIRILEFGGDAVHFWDVVMKSINAVRKKISFLQTVITQRQTDDVLQLNASDLAGLFLILDDMDKQLGLVEGGIVAGHLTQ